MSDGDLIPTGTILARGRDEHGDPCISAAVTMTVAAWESIIGSHAYLGLLSLAGLQPCHPLEARIAILLSDEAGTCESNLEHALEWIAENGDCSDQP